VQADAHVTETSADPDAHVTETSADPEDLSDDQRAGVRALVDELRGDRSVVDLSAHMLAVCRA